MTSGSSTYKNQLVATYAHRVSGSTSETTSTGDKVTIPFENVSMGTLTVGKMVVSNAKEDIKDFEFKAVFTYFGEKDHVIEVNDPFSKKARMIKHGHTHSI